MEAPAIDPTTLPESDPLELIEALSAGRAGFPPLEVLDHLYRKPDLSKLTLRQHVEEQVERIQSMRIGDAILGGYNLEFPGTHVDCTCCCGTHFKMHIRSAQRALTLPGASSHYAPVGSNPHFPAPEPATSRYCCPHIEEKLAKDYPPQYVAWVAMKKQVQTRISMYPASAAKVRIETAWFERATGFAQFIWDVGLPDGPGDMRLRKANKANGYTMHDYSWKHVEDTRTSRMRYPELSNRFYSLRSLAARQHRHFKWATFEQFLKDVKIPEDFSADPSKWRLRWDSAALKGYTEKNYTWERLHVGPVQADASWNLIARAEEIRQQFPFEELGLSPAQYNEALITWGMLVSDCNRVGDDLSDLLTEAINIVKGENYES